MKKALIMIISTLVSVIAIFALCVWVFGFSTTTKSDLNDYAKRRLNSTIPQQVMSDLEDLSVYKDILSV